MSNVNCLHFLVAV